MPRMTHLATAAAVVLAACSTSENPLDVQPVPTTPQLVVAQAGNRGVADLEEVEVCKYGSSASFSYTIFNRNTSTTTNGTFSLNDGDCTVLGLFDRLGADATVTETAPQSGFGLDRVDATVVTRVESNPFYTTRTETGPSIYDWVGGGLAAGGPRGVLFEFYNSRRGGGQGCTPGYWKQEHHFDSWPAPYRPTDLFSAYFEDAFPGKTLLQVLSQGGGKLIALGRHTVAALLNGASSGVSYPLSATQVINEFNATYPATNYGPQKDRFEAFNEAGCPLN